MIDTSLVLLVPAHGRALAQLAGAGRARLRAELLEHGALLFRGGDVGGVDGFAAAVRALSGEPLAYSERSSPRSEISGRVYTSTEYPAEQEIFLHNENSYQRSWPAHVWFWCVRRPATGGATPLADTRAVLRAIDPDVREEFRQRRWSVVRTFHPELGLRWQEVFGTEDRGEVADYCRRQGIVAEWLERDVLRTTAVRDAIHRHPVTGEEVWFNHATVFHPSTLPTETRQGLLEMYGEAALPASSYYGDGGRIGDEVAEHLRAAYRSASTRFDYDPDDVVVVDNMLTAHGREPYTGPRKVAVAMADAAPIPETVRA
ncbi:MAG TPA: TauD/TfdA family dioxygenase [Mycobacteriales bacterium]|nr:TauD/TfdA family dioxygenase [Mycobacteriales bacterium]